MGSTYTNLWRLEKQGDGENDSTWGQKVNNNLDLIEQGADGVETVALSGTTYSLTANQAAADEARQRVLQFTGTLTDDIVVSCPAKDKHYIVTNETAGDFALSFGPSGGATLDIPQGCVGLVYTDGTNVTQVGPWLNITSGALTFVGTGTASDPLLASTTDSDTGLFFTGSDDIGFAVGGAGEVYITPTGTGIGTSDPQADLHLNDDTTTVFQMTTADSGTTATDGFAIEFSAGEVKLIQRENAPLSFWTNNTKRMTIGADGTISYTSQPGAFPAGTQMLFRNSSAPTGWTKVTTYADYGLRLTSGAVGTGGTVAFTTVFTNQSISVDADAAHGHTAEASGSGRVSVAAGSNYSIDIGGHVHTTSLAGGMITSSGSLDLRLKYVDVILAQKD